MDTTEAGDTETDADDVTTASLAAAASLRHTLPNGHTRHAFAVAGGQRAAGGAHPAGVTLGRGRHGGGAHPAGVALHLGPHAHPAGPPSSSRASLPAHLLTAAASATTPALPVGVSPTASPALRRAAPPAVLSPYITQQQQQHQQQRTMPGRAQPLAHTATRTADGSMLLPHTAPRAADGSTVGGLAQLHTLQRPTDGSTAALPSPFATALESRVAMGGAGTLTASATAGGGAAGSVSPGEAHRRRVTATRAPYKQGLLHGHVEVSALIVRRVGCQWC